MINSCIFFTLKLYTLREHVNKLLENGSAYRCFCTERRLNILRRDAVKSQRVPKYDNRCRDLTKTEIHEKMKSNAHSCIRFKVCTNKNKYNIRN